MCARAKMNRHELNKTAIIKYKLCILCLSTLHIRCDLSCLHIPHTLPWPPRLEGCGRDELADQKKIFKATVWEPCSFQLIWAGLLFPCILPALMLTGLWAIGDYIMESTHNAFWVLCWGTNDSRIRCLKSRVHQQMVVVAEEGLWGSYLCVNSYNGGASTWKLVYGLVSIKPVL